MPVFTIVAVLPVVAVLPAVAVLPVVTVLPVVATFSTVTMPTKEVMLPVLTLFCSMQLLLIAARRGLSNLLCTPARGVAAGLLRICLVHSLQGTPVAPSAPLGSRSAPRADAPGTGTKVVG